MNPSLSAKRMKNFREKVFFRKLRSLVDGNIKVEHVLTQIKGIDVRFAQAIVKVAEINPYIKIGEISKKHLNRLEEIILNPINNGIPDWMVNHHDLKNGIDQQIVGNKLDLLMKRDVDHKKRNKKKRKILFYYPEKLKVKRIGLSISKLDDFHNKIRSLMIEREQNLLEVNEIYLPELIDNNLLDFGTKFKIKDEVRNYLKEQNIRVKYTRKSITFYMIE